MLLFALGEICPQNMAFIQETHPLSYSGILLMLHSTVSSIKRMLGFVLQTFAERNNAGPNTNATISEPTNKKAAKTFVT